MFKINVKAAVSTAKQLGAIVDAANKVKYDRLNLSIDLEKLYQEMNKIRVHKMLYLINLKTHLYVNGKRYDFYDFRTKQFKSSDFNIIIDANNFVSKYDTLKYRELNNIFNQYVVKQTVETDELYVMNQYNQAVKINKSEEYSDKHFYMTKTSYVYKKSKEILVYTDITNKKLFDELYSYLQSKIGLNLVLFQKGSKKVHRVATYSRFCDTIFCRDNMDVEFNKEFNYHKDLQIRRSQYTINGDIGLVYKFFNIEYTQFKEDLRAVYNFYKINKELINRDLSLANYESIKNTFNKNGLNDFDEILDELIKEIQDKADYQTIGFDELIKNEEK